MRYRPEKPLHVNLIFFLEPKQETTFKKVTRFVQSCSVITPTSTLLLCRSPIALPETLKKIVTFLKTLQPQFFAKLKFAKKKNLASSSRLNLLISQPQSYLQNNLFQVFRLWGPLRERSEQEKQRGGGVGDEREGQTTLPFPLFLDIFPALSLRAALHYLNAWIEQAICCMNNSTINCTERD